MFCVALQLFMLQLHPLLYKKRKYCECSITRIKKNLFCCIYVHNLLVHSYGKVLSFLSWSFWYYDTCTFCESLTDKWYSVNTQSRACSFSMLSLSKECYLWRYCFAAYPFYFLRQEQSGVVTIKITLEPTVTFTIHVACIFFCSINSSE